MSLLALCMGGHLLLAGAISSPWWVPDLTLAGLVLAVIRVPRRWLLFSATAALWVAMWAVRHPASIFVGYLAVGAVVRLLSESWDVSDPRVLCVLAAAASALVTYGMLWIDDIWSLPLIGLAAEHVLVTGLSVPVIGRVFKRT